MQTIYQIVTYSDRVHVSQNGVPLLTNMIKDHKDIYECIEYSIIKMYEYIRQSILNDEEVLIKNIINNENKKEKRKTKD